MSETESKTYNIVYERLVQRDDDLVGLIAYALYKQTSAADNFWFQTDPASAEVSSLFAASTVDSINWMIIKNIIGERVAQKNAQRQVEIAKARAEQLARQRAAEAVAEGRRRTEQELAEGKFQIASSAEDRQIVEQVKGVYSKRRVRIGPAEVNCGETYEYMGGRVNARSVEGAQGVFLVSLIVVFKDEGVLYRTSLTSEICGAPERDLRPGESSQVTTRVQLRKYDTGWMVEKFL